MTNTNGDDNEEPEGWGLLREPSHHIAAPLDGEILNIPTPTHWPQIPASDAQAEWNELRTWVEQLCERFAHLDHHVIPRCWWRHNEHVEALCALRDHERSSFSHTSPAIGPVDWFRALRDIGAMLRSWTGELGCGSTHHASPAMVLTPDVAEWERFVEHDGEARQSREIGQASK